MVFCACNDVTHKAERKWLAATCQIKLGKFLSRKRSKNLVVCYSYWPSKGSRYSNRAVIALILVLEESIT